MDHNKTHITEYKVLAKILLLLIFCTFLTISITSFNLAAFTVTIALLIAGVKGFLVLSYFMHLKYESLLLRILVGSIFLLFIIIVLITFIDYSFR
ncbi:MAG: cytochrome C oxidase subunit IV family protein [Bacteroidetes bacterium]|nr:cytochrome C oxidase subunit IV family protein [Bacteroidota bacterium]